MTPYHETEAGAIYCGDCVDVLRELPENSVHCCVTSPPYFGLRDYQVDGQIGLEETPEAYVEKMVDVFRGVRRVLRDDGTLWLNLGDSYAGGGGHSPNAPSSATSKSGKYGDALKSGGIKPQGHIKQKDLIGIPWRVALALQADGWYLRQDIIWCLSGGTRVYARTQKGEMPSTIKDIARLDPTTVDLWNGEKWTRLLGISKSKRKGDEVEIVLRSGERISCTPTHRFPTDKGLRDAKDIRVGDILSGCILPEPETVKDCAIDEDAAWFAGLYLAEGSRSGSALQIAGHVKESERWDRVQRVADKYGGSATRTINGNGMNIRVYGRILHAIVDELVSGKTAHDKGFAPCVWKYSNRFIAAMVDGYLSGDGHQDGERWRLSFCRNYNLEASLRTACARLGYSLTLNMSSVPYNGGMNQTFRGELRKTVSGHWNNKSRSEVVEIRKARARQFYDIGVEDDPHLFALASGVLTHNSKPNPMPESVKDRCTKAHEYIFLLSKSQRYFYDAEAVREPHGSKWIGRKILSSKGCQDRNDGGKACETGNPNGRNRRSVWTVATQPMKAAHFATFPPKLIEPCILAGCPEGGVVLDPFFGSGTTGIVAYKHGRKFIGIDLSETYLRDIAVPRIEAETQQLRLFA